MNRRDHEPMLCLVWDVRVNGIDQDTITASTFEAAQLLARRWGHEAYATNPRPADAS